MVWSKAQNGILAPFYLPDKKQEVNVIACSEEDECSVWRAYSYLSKRSSVIFRKSFSPGQRAMLPPRFSWVLPVQKRVQKFSTSETSTNSLEQSQCFWFVHWRVLTFWTCFGIQQSLCWWSYMIWRWFQCLSSLCKVRWRWGSCIFQRFCSFRLVFCWLSSPVSFPLCFWLWTSYLTLCRWNYLAQTLQVRLRKPSKSTETFFPLTSVWS